MIKNVIIKIIISFCLTTIIFSSFSGCSKSKDGVLEIYEFEKSLNQIAFKAVLFEDQDSYPEETEFTIKSTTNSNIKGFFWPNKSAKDLGYTKLGSGYYYSKEGITYPGKNGNWKGLRPPEITTGGSGGGSNGTGLCDGSYNGPEGDIQLDSFCQYAYAKRCLEGKSLNDVEVQGACQTYNSIREPGVPDCPYCK